MQPLSKKTQYFTDSVIRRMTRIAIANNAINLAQGFPDFDPPKALLDRLAEVAHAGPTSTPSPWAPPTSAGPWPRSAAASRAAPWTRRPRWW